MYDEAMGSETRFVDGPRLGDDLGLTRVESDDVMRYWEGEGLLRYVAEEGLIALTHPGIVEIERASSSPAVPTEHFPPGTVVVVTGNVHSQIQVGTVGSSQELVHQQASTTVELRFLDAMQSVLLTDPPSDPIETANLLEMIEIARSSRNRRLSASLLESLKAFAIGMGASGAWAGAVELAHQLHI
jgi:hypothetical protein